MAVSPTYPGVYIEEVPSGVHTITGVATSITAFVGYTARGDVDNAIHIFSFADFERGFGGLAIDSPLSYAVKQFFQNGGSEAYVVRVAKGAVSASTTLLNLTTAGVSVLDATAASEGSWGNILQIEVDYNTANPGSWFNLTVTEMVDDNGQLVPGRVETFRNLSMNSFHSSYAVDVVNAGSKLIVLKRLPLTFNSKGTSTSAPLTLADATPLPAGYRLSYLINGKGPFTLTVAVPTPPAGATLSDALDAIIADVEAAINAVHIPGVTGSVVNQSLEFTAETDANNPAERSSISFVDAAVNNIAARLHLGVANRGSEREGAATFRPAQSGTTGGAVSFPLAAAALGEIELRVKRGTGATALATIKLKVWGASTPFATPPTDSNELATQMRAAIQQASPSQPLLAGSTVMALNDGVRVLAGSADPNLFFEFANVSGDTTAADIKLVGGHNFTKYAPGSGATALAQVAGQAGNNGTAPGETELLGNQAAKTGLYALEDVDLFNLLVMPDATAANGMMGALTEAIAYCVQRRAFMIIDAPEQKATFADAQSWISGPAAPLRSRNAALYFPRLRQKDPLMNNVMRTFGAAGAIAGLYARTDAERGVWKAPAGTSAVISGALGLSYTLTDKENGTLNPLGLNCLRTFPVYGTVSWGARTARGADAMADEYKYVPVRRLALFLEESLYRGTQWVVFEPNDEPLWAQIRLNLGAFMHNLFSQGAFQGQTPRDAYFVKCDKETTTQNDIDLGRVNIVVGFAPLKPAEFVIIKIQQIAGAIQT